MWGDRECEQIPKKARVTPIIAKPGLCHPGSSYNPQLSDHQDIVAAAVAVELRRAEALSERNALSKWNSRRAASEQISELSLDTKNISEEVRARYLIEGRCRLVSDELK